VIITLTTDFGTADGYAGAMKGVIASRAPECAIVDITHDLARHDIAAAAYALAVAAPEFPAGTVHVAVVDPGVGSERQAVVVAANGQLFVGPDNGIFALAAARPGAVHRIEAPAFLGPRPSATFHGRDVFAPAAAALARGEAIDEAGPATEPLGRLATTPRAVVHVDRFGNLITDIGGGELRGAVRIAGRTIEPVTTFADVEAGALLAYVGSAQTIEIAVREGSAAERLGVCRGEPVEV
jgi:S-adenosylmethionine hydrolase